MSIKKPLLLPRGFLLLSEQHKQVEKGCTACSILTGQMQLILLHDLHEVAESCTHHDFIISYSSYSSKCTQARS